MCFLCIRNARWLRENTEQAYIHCSGTQMFYLEMHLQLMTNNFATLVYKIKIKDKHLCDVYQQGMSKDRDLCMNVTLALLYYFVWPLLSVCLCP